MWWFDTPAPRRGSPSPTASTRRLALVALGTHAGLLLTGCGFHLRKPPQMAFSTLALIGFATRSPLEAELRRRLAPGVRVIDPPGSAQVVIEALADARERSVVSSTTAAQVRALQLRLLFSFRARTSTGRDLLPKVELLLARDLSYSESTALAKEYEEAELFREMQADVVTQVMRRMASIVL